MIIIMNSNNKNVHLRGIRNEMMRSSTYANEKYKNITISWLLDGSESHKSMHFSILKKRELMLLLFWCWFFFF